MGKFEDEYLDVLQNIEFALVQAYRQDEEMTDYDAEAAVNGLIRVYSNEKRRRAAPELRLSDQAEEAFELVKGMCDWRLGRESLVDGQGAPIPVGEGAGLSLDEIIACLKRVRRSIQLWRKEGGRRGYFEYVNGFLP